ncbi:hypothetical protein OSTOST_21387, partial [Ostertagia ostertagi]
MEPSVANDERYDPHLSAGTRGSAGSTRVQHQGETPLLRQPYMSSYPSNVSSAGSRRKPANLSDVLSTSGDTTDLVRNLSSYVNTKIPPGLSICVLIFLSVFAFALILMGTFHIPFCQVQPMIPIWLTVAGILFILSATLRIYRMIPSPRSSHRSQPKSLDLCCRLSEGLLVVVNVVWLTLGEVSNADGFLMGIWRENFVTTVPDSVMATASRALIQFFTTRGTSMLVQQPELPRIKSKTFNPK